MAGNTRLEIQTEAYQILGEKDLSNEYSPAIVQAKIWDVAKRISHMKVIRLDNQQVITGKRLPFLEQRTPIQLYDPSSISIAANPGANEISIVDASHYLKPDPSSTEAVYINGNLIKYTDISITLTFSDSFIAGNTIDLLVNNVAMTTVAFNGTHTQTLTDLATQLATQFSGIVTSVTSNGINGVVIVPIGKISTFVISSVVVGGVYTGTSQLLHKLTGVSGVVVPLELGDTVSQLFLISNIDVYAPQKLIYQKGDMGYKCHFMEPGLYTTSKFYSIVNDGEDRYIRINKYPAGTYWMNYCKELSPLVADTSILDLPDDTGIYIVAPIAMAELLWKTEEVEFAKEKGLLGYNALVEFFDMYNSQVKKNNQQIGFNFTSGEEITGIRDNGEFGDDSF